MVYFLTVHLHKSCTTNLKIIFLKKRKYVPSFLSLPTRNIKKNLTTKNKSLFRELFLLDSVLHFEIIIIVSRIF